MATSNLNDNLAKSLLDGSESDYRENPLESYQQHQERRLKELSQLFEKLCSRFSDGLILLYNRLGEMNVPTEEFSSYPSIPTIINNLMKQGGGFNENKIPSLQQIAGLSNETMALLYSCAALFLAEKDKDKAVTVFETLTILNPKVWLFWMGYAEALVGAGKVMDALEAFRVAISISPLEPSGYVNAAKIAAENNLHDEADEIVREGRELISELDNTDETMHLVVELDRLEDLIKSYKERSYES